MRNNANALIQILVEPLRITGRKIYAPMATIGLITRTTERRLPGGIVKTNRIADKGHPIRDLRLVILLSVRLIANQSTRTLLIVEIVHTRRRATTFDRLTCNHTT